MLLHLGLNAFLMASGIMFLIFQMKGFALGNYGISSVLLAYAMGGIPIIVMAFNGVRYRNEAQVRMYLYYLWITIVIMLVLIIKEFIISGPCEHLPGVFSKGGEAWACGIARYINIAIIVGSVAILAYFQHVVYSFTEDIAECGGGPELADLTLNKDFYRKSASAHSMYSTIEGMAEAGEKGVGGWNSSSNPDGFASGAPIFGGTRHEMNYPPNLY